MAGDGHHLQVTSRERRHVTHQQIADNNARIRPGAVRAPGFWLDAWQPHSARVRHVAGRTFRKCYVSNGMTFTPSNESEAVVAECVSRGDHDNSTLVRHPVFAGCWPDDRRC